MSEAAGRCSRTPAIAEANTMGASAERSPAANAFDSSVQHDMWTWPLEPSSPGFVFARKLARSPRDAATRLTPNFQRGGGAAGGVPARRFPVDLGKPGPRLGVNRRQFDPQALERGNEVGQ